MGKKSFWWSFIKELDRQRARGVQAVESPLLWSDEELSGLLQVHRGSLLGVAWRGVARRVVVAWRLWAVAESPMPWNGGEGAGRPAAGAPGLPRRAVCAGCGQQLQLRSALTGRRVIAKV